MTQFKEGDRRTQELAKKAGKASARARARKGLKAAQLGPLESPEDAQRWLRVVGIAVAGGDLEARAAREVIGSVRAWLQAADDRTLQRLEEAEAALAEIVDENKRLQRELVRLQTRVA